jgi:acetolactate synthase-1/2/3 large subunit
MAYGYAQASGRVGAYAVVPGPGVHNTTAALATAYACNSPVLCITVRSPRPTSAASANTIPDQLGVIEPDQWRRAPTTPRSCWCAGVLPDSGGRAWSG